MTFEHLLTVKDLDKATIEQLIAQAIDLKQNPQKYQQALAGKSIATIFEKPSLRTRVSFDVGIQKLGGHAVYLDQQNGALGKRESVKDFAMNLSCWVDGIVARVFSQKTLEELAEYGSVPVINSLSDLYHPCQALADFQALTEQFGSVEGKTLAYVGDGNNVTHSLMLTAAILGCNMVVVTPPGHSVDGQVVVDTQELCAKSGAKLVISNDINDLKGVDAIYADTWISMGDETPFEVIAEKFMPYQVNKQLMAMSGAQYFMHCQPAHREQEVTSDVLDGKQSIIMQQAENRMHAQNAVMLALLQK
ncbi:ornithine carbamoyltransferase [Neiella sp. HB171785]|uniref:Ornithine carbamoyltransferase n=2 Tax=Neiella TaxID=1434025 RepID=A0A8J6UI05_9GAMM|nr:MULTISPECIES: ornithine carbamoyltransferase [Neiella]MBD1387918.1 ornithine carbamoyltransferase [Neiella litorisoli]GGA63663.1 ornithine carbamoyltransferase [Neiella marina]